MFHASGDFLRHVFKKVDKIYEELYYLKERFNKMEIEIDSENESQLKRKTSTPVEESLAEKVKKCPCLFDKSKKTHKERHISQKSSLSKTFAHFSRFDYFFFEVK